MPTGCSRKATCESQQQVQLILSKSLTNYTKHQGIIVCPDTSFTFAHTKNVRQLVLLECIWGESLFKWLFPSLISIDFIWAGLKRGWQWLIAKTHKTSCHVEEPRWHRSSNVKNEIGELKASLLSCLSKSMALPPSRPSSNVICSVFG